MAYAAWSVVLGEQPSTAKWNILGTNDASFNDGTGIANGAIVTDRLADLAVTNAKIANGTIEPPKNKFVGFSVAIATGDPEQVTPTGVVTLVTFPTVNYDTESGWNGGAFTYTVPFTGYWRLSISILFRDVADPDTVQARISLNDAAGGNLVLSGREWSSGNSSDLNATNTNTVYLTAGDVLRGFSFHNDGGNVNLVDITSETFMEGQYMGV